ncbi:Alpha-crystallin A chain, partial [Plecturocebus cupreus]
ALLTPASLQVPVEPKLNMDVTIQHPWFKRTLGPFYPSRLFDQFFGEGLFEYDLLPFLSSTISPYYRQSLFRSVLDSGISEPQQGGALRMAPHSVFGFQVRSDRDKFVIFLDVKHFSPEDLTVKVQDDFVEIHGKHNERQGPGHGYSGCTRPVTLPAGRPPSAVSGAGGSVSGTGRGGHLCSTLRLCPPRPQDDHGYISREFHRRYRLPSNVDQSALSCTLSADGMLTFTGPKIQTGLDATHAERAIPVSREEKPSSAPSS